MRVTQQMLFDRYVRNMNTSLSELIELNLKTQTQKKVNRPSDDPTSMVQILDHRDTLRRLSQYQENIDTAKGWLGRSDETLMQVSTLLTRAKELAEQAATGTLGADNREQISYEMRSIFEQLVGLSNMDYEDKSLYAGHKTGSNAFKQILWLTSNDQDFNDSVNFTIQGSAEKTVLVQFYDSTNATATGDAMALNDANLAVRYSVDGGQTFETDGTISVSGGQVTVDLPQGGVAVVLDSPTATVKVSDFSDTNVADGTWLWVRPSAQYLGDDEDAIVVDNLGAGTEYISGSVTGNFSNNVVVRIDNETAVDLDGEINYSYSLNGGLTWVEGNLIPADGTASNAVLSIASKGILTLSSNGGNTLQPGSQFIIRPRTASIEFDISASETVRVNDIGSAIFGGIYQDPDKVLSAAGARIALWSSNASVVFDNAGAPTDYFNGTSNAGIYNKNLFETLGNLVAFMETNTQTGIQQSLENLKLVQEHILNMTASVGGREHRLEVAEDIIDGLELNEEARLSTVEDADLAELMIDLAQQEIVYEAVLKSSAKIMQMNLMSFL
ncbi:MAG: flagellar hook-associated protein FlgL [Desulfovibrionaceae bacterium]|nr:flagellar hook-associated protein FlgL [Desulfovibrionaceae bacterium]